MTLDVLVLAHEGVGAGVERPELGAARPRRPSAAGTASAQRRVEPDAADDGGAVDAGQDAVDDDGAGPRVRGDAQALLAAAGGDAPRTRRASSASRSSSRKVDAVVDDEHRRRVARARDSARAR